MDPVTRSFLLAYHPMFSTPIPGALRLMLSLVCICFWFSGARTLTAATAPVAVGLDGWLFLSSELRFLQQSKFWGKAATQVSRSAKPEHADPIPAIVQFNDQLRDLGVQLLLVPVPPKASLHSNALEPNVARRLQLETLGSFFSELENRGVQVLDLRSAFASRPSEGPFYCKTDSHWSGRGCVRAAELIAEMLRPSLAKIPAIVSGQKHEFRSQWTQVDIHGDLAGLLPGHKIAPETLELQQISDTSGEAIRPDPGSPLLLLGDSHTLVFHEFLGERSGLFEQLALQTGIVPDLIGTRGSGATSVRVSLLRRSLKNSSYLASKKIIVWCFAAREFTESDQGWQPLPLRR